MQRNECDPHSSWPFCCHQCTRTASTIEHILNDKKRKRTLLRLWTIRSCFSTSIGTTRENITAVYDVNAAVLSTKIRADKFMTEEVLGSYPCIVRKEHVTVYITTDRIIFHTLGTTADESQVILLTNVSGFVMNKPRPELPPEQQKALIKIQYRESVETELLDRVVDFSGDQKFENCRSCEALLRIHAGDKAEERRLKAKEQQDRIALVRRRFLAENPDIEALFVYLTTEGGLSQEDFWEQHQDQVIDREQLVGDSDRSYQAIPAPLRRPDLLSADVSSNVLNMSEKKGIAMTPEKAEEIFQQFPRAKQLFDQLVPNAISEKLFWKRFFNSQYFSLSQGQSWASSGSSAATKSDAIFDSMLQEQAAIEPIGRPGEIVVDPDIDLSGDWYVAESGVFAFREAGTDSANRLEVGGKVPFKDSQAHTHLVKRFNASVNLGAENAPESAELLGKRRTIEAKVHESNYEPESMHDTEHISRTEIERLRRTRRKIETDGAASCAIRFSTKEKEISSGMTGVPEATVRLTQELVFRPAGLGDVARKAKKLETLPEASDLNEYLDRVMELLRFFYASKMREGDKRNRLLSNLNKVRTELNNALVPRIRTEWNPTVNMINHMISNAEIVNATLERNIR